jgi:sulfoxide reductase heme-binding subunit YedZ
MKLPKMSVFQWAVHIGAWIPLILILLDYFRDNLTANPIQDVTFRTGKAALVLLILSLAATPANTLLGFKPAIKVRRALGLYAFMYVVLHFFVFVGWDYGFDLGLIIEDVGDKRYVLVGLAASLLLLPLAITSTHGWMRRLGKSWRRLHMLVYLAAILAVIHYLWVVKADIRQPLDYGAAVLLLLIARLSPVRKGLSGFRQNLQGKLRKLGNIAASEIRPAMLGEQIRTREHKSLKIKHS